MGAMSPSTSRPPADTHPQRILIILGHPSASSLCAGLADAYAQGARDSGAEVRPVSYTHLTLPTIYSV